ncbi:helix-turn-helix domain-containing protein [Streptomyces specialis]|uniref:helix-turn-helix domain-containing protein n=1 Tax=Streptomyces specialis TaxID=498367 RepID=UPI00073F4CDE|nr:helix-turn-helix transcriptional regulator [Streptomyces specialis]
MTVAEFIVETQWTLLILLFLASFVLAMLFGKNFRAAVLSRTWRVGPDGLTSEAPAALDTEDTVAALEAVTQSDAEIAETLAGDEGGPINEGDVAAYRREAIEELIREAVWAGWNTSQVGFTQLPPLEIEWDTEDGPRILYGGEPRDRYMKILRRQFQRSARVVSRSRALEVGLRISRERSRVGVSRAELARRAGVAPGLIASMETGARQRSYGSYQPIADALGVPLERLVGEEEALSARDRTSG